MKYENLKKGLLIQKSEMSTNNIFKMSYIYIFYNSWDLMAVLCTI